MAEKLDLWGELAPADMRTPVSLLREQAALLGEKTGYVVVARVETTPRSGFFNHRLILVAAALGDYEYELLKIRHGVDLYPVTDARTGEEMEDEELFLEWLHQQLTSPATVKVVGNLVALANP